MKQDASAFAPRFWSRVKVGQPHQCWPWLAAHDGEGRGMIRYNGRRYRAPRIAWMLKHGELPPDDLQVCHSCDNPNCVNPDHLWLGTMTDNMRDAWKKGRITIPHQRGHCGWQSLKTHCKHGHPFSQENTLTDYRGARRCRECNQATQRRYYERTKLLKKAA